ncbi:MAG: DNA repair protein RecN [Gammaproteobacteria bacterium]|nr:DNA repair protein RecN [Gammaproteobacteria bacterium]
MLEHLHIENFAIIENLDLDLSSGMTVITGDTGAGKSIVIDALDIALGHRADSKFIREGAARCEINASFDINHCKNAQDWLEENDMENDASCIIRRVITTDGRSKNYINGRAVTLQQLRLLALELIQIHAQHEHYALLKKEEQCAILDRFAQHADLLMAVKAQYETWRKAQLAWQDLLALGESDKNKLDFLSYQLQEIKALQLREDELEALHLEQKKLTHSQDLMLALSTALDTLQHHNDHSVLSSILKTHRELSAYQKILPELGNILNLFNSATVHLEEASNELNGILKDLHLDPKRLQIVEARLQAIYQLARKMHVPPEQLPDLEQKLTLQLEILQNVDEKALQLEKLAAAEKAQYQLLAEKLSASRQKSAKKLNEAMSSYLQKLSLPHGQFKVVFGEPSSTPTPSGLDQLEFHIQTNVGQPLQALAKIASGGELSRASLALQLISSQQDNTPTLIFDEVDVGIGGKTADVVGELLRQLGEKTQVICITHQPQVAARGHHHLRIEKEHGATATASRLLALDTEQRTQEIARMLGGKSQTALAHAKELLEIA